jgi:hypothetical protein
MRELVAPSAPTPVAAEPVPARDAVRWLHVSAALGSLAWAAVLLPPWRFAAHVLWIERIVILGALVIAPLALSLAAAGAPPGPAAAWHRLAARLQPVGAALGLLAVCLRPGLLAGALAGGWLATTALHAGCGLLRALTRGYRPIEELAVDLGLIYLPVGGVWLVASRLGTPLLGFAEPWVMLTAAHFHYAGLAAPVIAGAVGRALHTLPGAPPGPGWLRAYALAAVGIMAGPPLVAAGIALWPAVEVASALLLSAALLGLTAVTLRGVVPRLPARAAVPLAVAVASLVISMGCACAYAVGAFLGIDILLLPTMVWVHGLVNALGFAVPGLLAFALAPPASRWRSAAVPFSRLAARWRVGARFFEDIDAVDPHPAAAPTGLVDRLDEYGRDGFDPARVHPDIRAFYEQTARFRLYVVPAWRPGFRLGARLFRWLMRSIDQLGLPRDPVADDQMHSRIVALRDDRDGRSGVRAWIRTHGRSGAVVYAAAYAVHRSAGIPYMNIAFPLPGGSLASVLRMDPWPDAGADGLVLSTLPRAGAFGDQGIYLVYPRLAVRLPMDETITVATPAWAGRLGVDPGAAPPGAGAAVVLARHDMWLLGVRFLTLIYWLARDIPGVRDVPSAGTEALQRAPGA